MDIESVPDKDSYLDRRDCWFRIVYRIRNGVRGRETVKLNSERLEMAWTPRGSAFNTLVPSSESFLSVLQVSLRRSPASMAGLVRRLAATSLGQR